VELRERDVEKLETCTNQQPGVKALAAPMVVHGQQYLCAVKYSSSFAGEQLQSLTTSLSKALQAMRRLSVDLLKPQARFTEQGIRNKINRWLSAQFLSDLLRYELTSQEGRWRLQFDVDNQGLHQLLAHRLGRTVLLTNRLDWSAEQIVAGYSGQQQIEKIFRGLKNGAWLEWNPMHHWTDSKIRVHAFYCMVGISLLQHLHHQAQTVWPGLSMEQLLEQLGQIQQFQLLYPPLGEKGPQRVATVMSKQTLAQQSLAELFGLGQPRSTQRG